LLSVLVHFFQDGRWGSLVETTIEGQSLTAEDQLFILMQAGLYLRATRGMGAPEARICHERAEPLCHSLNQPRLLCLVLDGQFHSTLMTNKLSATMQIAARIYSLAKEQDDAAVMLEGDKVLAVTHFFLGDFESARQCARHGVQLWRSGKVRVLAEEYHAPVVECLLYWAVCEWHFGEIASCHALMDEAISLAKELKDWNAVPLTLNWAAALAVHERNPAKVDRLASDLIELSTRHNFSYYLALGATYRGWARSVSGNAAEGIPWIEQGIRDIRATGTVLAVPFYLTLKADALHLADRTSEALEAIDKGLALAERFEQRRYVSDLHRFRGVLLAALGADEAQIEVSFGEAIRIAKEQKSVSLEKRAEATYAEYRQRKALGEHGFRLPLF
jgi:tetratricopeptide (TPR) repeat protein